MSIKLINYLNFRQFGVKLFGNLALIHSVVWRYKASEVVPDAKRIHDVIISAGWLLLYDVVGPVCESSDVFVFLL